MSKPIVISVLGDVRDLTSKLDAGESRLGRFGSTAGKVGRVAAAGLLVAGAAVVALGVSSVKHASDAQQSLGATETVFGKYADTVVAKSGQAARSVGLSANAYRENSNLLGSLLKNQGVATDQLAGKTESLISTSADLAATYGGTTTTAVEAMSAAYKGEFNQLEKYGISLKASTITAELAARGQDKLTGAALDAAKQQATTDLITRQAGDAIGAFGRESGTLANQQQVLGAQVENLQAKVGTLLLPVLTSLATFANNTLLPGLEALGPPIAAFASVVAEQAGPVLATFGAFLMTTVVPALVSLGGFITSTVLPALGQLGGFLAANVLPVLVSVGGFVTGSLVPALAAFGGFIIGTVVPAAITLGATIASNLAPIITTLGDVIRTRVVPAATLIVAKFREWQPALLTVATGVGKVIGFVYTLASAILGKVLPPVIRFAGFLLATLVPVLLTVVGGVIKTVAAVVSFGGALIGGIAAAGRFAAGILDKIGAATRYVAGIPGKALAALGDLGGLLLNAGAQLVQGLIDGISNKIQAVKDKMSELASAVKGFFPGSPVKEGPLTSWNNGGAGTRLVDGLITGLDGRRTALRGALSRVADTVAATTLPTLALDAGMNRRGTFTAAAGTAGRFAPQRLTLELTAEQLHELERGRRLAVDLRAYTNAGGTL